MQLRSACRSGSVAVAAIALLCVMAGCGTSSTPSQTSPPTTAAPASPAAPASTAAPTAAACEDVAALRSSLEALTKVRPAQDGVDALKTAIDNVKTNLDAAEASASEALKPEVQQVKIAFAELQTAANGLTADNRREKLPAIASAMKQVGTATAALRTKLTEACPGS
jgi:hypothetical protein